MAIPDRGFRDYVAAYTDAIRSTRYAELDVLQPPPFGTLSEGGAGTAYALARLGETRRARRWIAAVLADRRAVAYQAPGGSARTHGSYLFGRAGVRWVQAILEPEAGAPAFARVVRVPGAMDELAHGTAGHLLALALLVEHRPDPRLARLGAKLAVHLERAVRARAEHAWAVTDTRGVAHGWAGILYALVVWHRVRCAPLPGWIADALVRLAAAATPGAGPAYYAGAWCNGEGGMVLLWVAAFAATGMPAFVDAARASARVAAAANQVESSLCCGRGGVAFALLALHRIDPRGRWRTQARAIAARAIADATLRWTNGLFQGHPGLVCLALDCIADAPRGFPAIETS